MSVVFLTVRLHIEPRLFINASSLSEIAFSPLLQPIVCQSDEDVSVIRWGR